MNENQFGKWLSGFVDGEGNFQIWIDRHYLRRRFRIRLHIDDIKVLYLIQAYFKVGEVRVNGNSCLYIVQDLNSLLTVIIPFFEKYKLFTTKWLDFLSFKEAVLFINRQGSSRLDDRNLRWRQGLIKDMNSTRTTYNKGLIPVMATIDLFWLLGLIEAEGTFGFKSLLPYFQLGLHSRNDFIIKQIGEYLSALTQTITFSTNSPAPLVTYTLNKSTGVLVLSIANVDALYDYFLIPLLQIQFHTRKMIDFHFWRLGLYLHKWGYYYMEQGRVLMVSISQYINDGRYTTNTNPVRAPAVELIKAVLAMVLPIRLTPDMTHLTLSKMYGRLLKNGREIYVYVDGVLVNTQPVSSFADAATKAGLARNSARPRRYFDTGKTFVSSDGRQITFKSKRD